MLYAHREILLSHTYTRNFNIHLATRLPPLIHEKRRKNITTTALKTKDD